MRQFFTGLYNFVKYNVKIVFGNKFPYFILAAIGFYLLIVAIYVLSDEEITEASGFTMLLVPSLLLIFYPTCFGIQNDQDTKIIEVIFGIPNYRYKVWLFRLFIAYVITFAVVLSMAYLTNWIVVEVQPVEIAAQALVPAFFIGMCAFMFSTILRNGNGTAVVLIIVGILLFFLDMVLGVSYWNVLMNPYDIPLEQNPIIFYDTLFYNRIAVMTASIVLLIVGLNSMRKREKFI